MSNVPTEVSLTLKNGRHTIYLTARGTAMQVMASTTASGQPGVSSPAPGVSVCVKGKKGKRRFSLANIATKGQPTPDEDDGDNGFAIEARFPGGGGRPRPVVYPAATMSHTVYQVAPQLPALLTQAEINRARTPAQRAILNHPVFSLLFHIHPLGGGLVANSASVGLNTFVGVSSIVLPGARASNKAIIEYEAIVAGGIYGNGVITGKSFVHAQARVQDNARVGDDAFVDQRTWIGGKVTVGGKMNIVTDDSGHMILGGFGNFVGAFDIVGTGKLFTGSHAYMKARQIGDLISSCQI